MENYWFQPKFFKKPSNAFLRIVVMTVNDEDPPGVYCRRRRWIYTGRDDALSRSNFEFELGDDSLDMTQPIGMLSKIIVVCYVFEITCVILPQCRPEKCGSLSQTKVRRTDRRVLVHRQPECLLTCRLRICSLKTQYDWWITSELTRRRDFTQPSPH